MMCDTSAASSSFPTRPTSYMRQPYDLSPAAAAAAAVVASATAVGSVVPNVGLRFGYPTSYSNPSSQYTAPHYQTPSSAYTNESTEVNSPHKHSFVDSQVSKTANQYEPSQQHQGAESIPRSYNFRSVADPYDYSQYMTHYNHVKSSVYPTMMNSPKSVSTASNDTSSHAQTTKAMNEATRGFYLPWTQSRTELNSSLNMDAMKTMNSDLSSGLRNKVTEHSRLPPTMGQPLTTSGADLLLHQASSLSQWDVNDPKLPKIRQFDTFTMWPQGHCRFAYQKSASEGARRHASGWAMRNTNNHNAQILKKSCLGVLLCTAEGCPLAMRPAICDKARRRQEGRPCCMPNCNGRIYNQPCRGHGGYPVTHFWREHGDTVYFQSKGTHDHIRPDLKPVRDTAARRRRQLQLEKLQQNRTATTAPSGENASLRSSDGYPFRNSSKLREASRMAGLVRKRAAERVECKPTNEASSPVVMGKANHADWTPAVDNVKIARTATMLLSDKPQSPAGTRPEPIFPSSPALGSYSVTNQNPITQCPVPHGFEPRNSNPCLESSVPLSTSYATGTHYPMNGMYCVTRFPPHLFGSRFDAVTTQSEHSPTPATFSSSFMKDLLYEEDLRKPEAKPLVYPGYTETLSQTGKSVPSLQLSQHQLPQHSLLVGPNSESTSGGLNASWSTPSPPTGGSSSLFGTSDLRNVMLAPTTTVEENDHQKDKSSVTSQTWRVDSLCQQVIPGTTTTTNTQINSPTRLPPNAYGLSTPTHATYGIQTLSALESPDNLIAAHPSSMLMSSSTPLSNGSILANRFAHQLTQSGGASYPTGYITPIPFYSSNGSDSRSTRVSSSSGEATSQESGSSVV